MQRPCEDTHSRKVAVCKSRREVTGKTNSANTFDLGISNIQKSEKKNFVVCCPVRDIMLQRPKETNTKNYFHALKSTSWASQVAQW